jgi:hypothetical protein
MTLDKKAIDTLLKLDNASLTAIIRQLAASAGVNPSTIRLGERELAGLRSALAVATDSDILRAGELIKQYKNGKNGN